MDLFDLFMLVPAGVLCLLPLLFWIVELCRMFITDSDYKSNWLLGLWYPEIFKGCYSQREVSDEIAQWFFMSCVISLSWFGIAAICWYLPVLGMAIGIGVAVLFVARLSYRLKTKLAKHMANVAAHNNKEANKDA